MKNQIIDKYHLFSDAVIQEICYKSEYDSDITVIITIRAYNWSNDNWEIIKLKCEEVILFKFFESQKICSTIINAALIKEAKDYIVLDFFATYYDNFNLEENPNSNFLIHCKKFNYEFLEYFISS